MWRERVKRQLELEKQQWLEARSADATSGARDATLSILSINKLLQFVSPANSSSRSGEALQALGIQRVELQPPGVQQNASLAEYLRHTKRSRGNEDATASGSRQAVQQVAYVSDSVWIMGFLRFRDAERYCTESELWLSDASGEFGCQALVLDPTPECVDRLVLVKKWVLIGPGAGPTAAAAAAGATATATATTLTSQRVRFGDWFLEIHELPTILEYENEPIDIPSQEAALRILNTHYPAQDPPLYIGPRPWRSAAAQESSDNVPILKTTPSSTAKAKPTKKVRAVFGRLVCVSPVAHQRVRSRDHFFAEVDIQCPNHERRQQQIIMFTGERNVRWRLFLRPGDQVLVTDLVKVQSQEHGIFMLQTTTTATDLLDEDSAQQQLNTQVFVWQQTQETLLPSEIGGPQYTEASQELEILDCEAEPSSKPEMLDCEGVLNRVLWNDCLEVQGDNDSFVICIFHFPGVDLGKIRAGTRIRILNAHVLRKSNPIDRKIVIGLCARSHFSVVAHSSAFQQCLRLPSHSSSNRNHLKKKLSCLGDRSAQPLPVSVWLAEAFEALITKFSFGRIATMSADSSKALTSFPEIRDREALNIFAKALQVHASAANSSSLSQNSTLSGQFLNSHAPDARKCASVQGGDLDKRRIPRGQIVRIRDLQQWGRVRLTQAYAEKLTALSTKSTSDRFCFQVPAEDLDWCSLVGCLRGNVFSGDLEICDRTGSMPLSIDHGSERNLGWDRENSTHLYVVRRFKLIMETHCAPGVVVRDFDKDVVVLKASCSLGDMQRVPMENVSVLPSGEQELTLFVTHVDPVKRPSVLSEKLRWCRPVYRHVHGIAFPTDHLSADKDLKKMPRRVEILISTSVSHWHVEKYGCYRIAGAIREEDSRLALAPDWSAASAVAIEEKAIVLTELFLSKVMHGANCIQTRCYEEIMALLREFDAPHQTMLIRRLEIYRMEPGGSIEPLRLATELSTMSTCPDHDTCVIPRVTHQGLLDFSSHSQTSSLSDLYQVRQQNPLLSLERSAFEISPQQLLLLSVLQHFAVRAEKTTQVLHLLRHPLPTADQIQREEIYGMLDGSSNGHEKDIHRTKLYSIVGVISEKRCYWSDKPDSPVYELGAANNDRASLVANQRKRERENGLPSEFQELMCVYKLRDLSSMDTIEVRVNASQFGDQPDLQPQSIVEFSKLQGFVARATYKVYMNWGICSGARVLHGSSTSPKLEAPCDAELYGAMTRSTIHELYHSQFVDRRLRRWVVRVIYMNKVVLKRKCRKCYSGLVLQKRQGSWMHEPITALSASTYYKPKPNTCPWYQIQIGDPQFDELTFASLSIRCTIDDGSAQAELHLENDVAWDLLACSKGVRRGFEELVRSQVKELSYPMGQASGTLAPVAFKDSDEHENEFSAMISNAKQGLRSVEVFGHQFYSFNRATSNGGSSVNEVGEREFESALKFGRDIQITTKRLANVRLEARRVDVQVPVKSVLRQRLASLCHQQMI